MINITQGRFENTDIPGALYAHLAIVTNVAARDAISGTPLVEGMLVFTKEEGALFVLDSDLSTWHPFSNLQNSVLGSQIFN